MRTLLIDNHDSYTYNLFQLIAEVTGVEPTVVLNDDPAWDGLSLDEFDAVVISPGPGHPGRSRDFGAARAVLDQAQLPLLGVCLGHQGLGLAAGAEVVAAPEPRHGHLTKVRHIGAELFHGIPQDFTAVRYHSLAIREPLPVGLLATAWAEDGVLMGVRHRTRPQWGVQFHPESILTEFGHLLIANFQRLALESNAARSSQAARRPGPATPARISDFPRSARPTVPPAASGYRLHTRAWSRHVCADALFTALYAGSTRAFWLDSAQQGGQARFSFLGDDAGPLAEFVRYDVAAGQVRIDRAGVITHAEGTVFDYLRSQLAERRIDAAELPFDFTAGYVGYLGYEMKADCGAVNRHQASTPDAAWLFADRIVAVDHKDGIVHALCLAADSPAGGVGADGWLDAIETAIDRLPAFVPDAAALPNWPTAGTATDPERYLTRDRSTYLADIKSSQDALRAGESYEICLTDSAWLPAPADSLGYYRILRRLNPAPYGAYLRFGEVDVASSSPERFLRITRDRTVETKPIKGTAPRGATPAEDARLRDALASDPKTRAENLMVLDLLRNDLGRSCTVGTVRVPSAMRVESYRTVHQLVSTVRGELRDGVDALDCVRDCFPGGSMTGAPKARTMELIDELETEARGVYSGTLGFLGCNGTADLSIVIRTAVFADGRMRLGAGGAIVLDSVPADEYDEMLLKLAAPLRAYQEWIRPRSVPARHRTEPAVARAPKPLGVAQ